MVDEVGCHEFVTFCTTTDFGCSQMCMCSGHETGQFFFRSWICLTSGSTSTRRWMHLLELRRITKGHPEVSQIFILRLGKRVSVFANSPRKAQRIQDKETWSSVICCLTIWVLRPNIEMVRTRTRSLLVYQFLHYSFNSLYHVLRFSRMAFWWVKVLLM